MAISWDTVKKKENDKEPIFHAVLQVASLTLRTLSDLAPHSNCFAGEETGAESDCGT